MPVILFALLTAAPVAAHPPALAPTPSPVEAPKAAAAAPVAEKAPAPTPSGAPAGDALKPPFDPTLDEPKLDTPNTDTELSMGWTLLRTLVVLGIVVMSIYVTLNWGLRKMLGLKTPTVSGSVVSVIERVPLDQRRALWVVKAANEYLLVGGADAALALITKLDSAEVEKLRAAKPTTGLTLSPFLQKLLMKKGNRP
jgi:flagellar biogenesis protein FliO